MKIEAPAEHHLIALRKLWQEAFGDTDEFLDTFYTTAFSADRCRCVVIDDNIAAALYWFDCSYKNKPIAYIYAVATAKAYRGQGICHKLIENTNQHLKNIGYEGSVLVPGSKKLFNLYADMGYKVCSYIKELSCEAKEANQNIQIRRIDKTEYAKLRREFLPESSIVQENENLDFLQTQAEFFTGKDFLLAARSEENNLYGVELLGDESVAKSIVHTLGFTNGKFRTPGSELPFAMSYTFEDNALPSLTYFGLAFD